MPTYRRATTDLLEVEAAVAALYPAFRAPLDAGRELRPAQLHARVNPLVQRVVAERSHTAAPAAKEFGSGVPCMGAAHDATPGSSSGAPPALASQLPFVSKYLILAAYVASRNKPTADRAVFDPGFRKKARRGAQAHDRMVRLMCRSARLGARVCDRRGVHERRGWDHWEASCVYHRE